MQLCLPANAVCLLSFVFLVWPSSPQHITQAVNFLMVTQLWTNLQPEFSPITACFSVRNHSLLL